MHSGELKAKNQFNKHTDFRNAEIWVLESDKYIIFNTEVFLCSFLIVVSDMCLEYIIYKSYDRN